MTPQLVQMFALGLVVFPACLFFGLRIKQSFRWALLALGSFGLLGLAYFFLTALHFQPG